ncbi:amidohydrolase family protein, partial [Streptomyces sp. SID10244]|nr:amidohydrolase family protein [Streptomyces sp. SID10244]
TIGGARVLGRADDTGSIEVGKLADLVLWDLSSVAHSGIDDPVAALVLGAVPPIIGTWVNGRRIVGDGTMLTVDTDAVAAEVAREHRRLIDKAS